MKLTDHVNLDSSLLDFNFLPNKHENHKGMVLHIEMETGTMHVQMFQVLCTVRIFARERSLDSNLLFVSAVLFSIFLKNIYILS